MKLHGLQKVICLTLTLLTFLTATSGSFSVSAASAEGEEQAVSGKFVTLRNQTRYRIRGGGYAEGFLEIDGSLYYFDPDSHRMMQSEWFQIGENQYYASEEGPLLTGKQTIEKRTYYFDADGVCCSSCWYEDNGTWLRLDADGIPLTGWFEDQSWYYLGQDGKMLAGQWLEQDGRWYYLDSDGRMVANKWVEWEEEYYYCDANGVMQKNCTVTTGGRKWYLDGGGRLVVSPDHPLDVPVVKQAPALPNGCEITALTELLRYNGFPVSHTTMSAKYLPRKQLTWSKGKMYGPDPNEYFVGNPEDDTGWYCLEGPIITAANRYLEEQGSALRAEKVSGADVKELKSYLKQGYPVMVWMTPGLREFGYSSVRWYLPDGTLYKPYIGTHGLVLTGIDEQAGTASFSDPARGKHTLSLSFFLRIYRAMGSRAVIIR